MLDPVHIFSPDAADRDRVAWLEAHATTLNAAGQRLITAHDKAVDAASSRFGITANVRRNAAADELTHARAAMLEVLTVPNRYTIDDPTVFADPLAVGFDSCAGCGDLIPTEELEGRLCAPCIP